MLRDPWPGQDLRKYVGRAMTGVVCPLRHAFQRASHILRWSVRDGRGLMEIAALGDGDNV